MHAKTHSYSLVFGMSCSPANVALNNLLAILLFIFLFLTLTAPASQGQYRVIHQFTGGADGGSPFAGLTSDTAGNLYGTTAGGGAAGLGTVFKMLQRNGQWVFMPLYSFRGGDDGANPAARVVVGPDGNLYGTTYGGGTGNWGTVFKLAPSANAGASVFGNWQETVLYRFTGGSDGATPSFGDLAFDAAGNIYGTTTNGGSSGQGVVFQLTPSVSGWTETVIHDFVNDADGRWPYSGLTFDAAGNAYGTTLGGGAYEFGTLYQLSKSPSGWVHTILHDFQGGYDGGNPIGGVTFTPSGRMLGTSSGAWNGMYPGTAFLLWYSGSRWMIDRVWDFGSGSYYYGGAGPWAAALGEPGQSGWDDVYGTTYASGTNGYGSVFKMYWECNGCLCEYYQTDLHDFTSDDAYPISNLQSDASGNLYGTASGWSINYSSGYGSVFEIPGALQSRTETAGAPSCTSSRK